MLRRAKKAYNLAQLKCQAITFFWGENSSRSKLSINTQRREREREKNVIQKCVRDGNVIRKAIRTVEETAV